MRQPDFAKARGVPLLALILTSGAVAAGGPRPQQRTVASHSSSRSTAIAITKPGPRASDYRWLGAPRAYAYNSWGYPGYGWLDNDRGLYFYPQFSEGWSDFSYFYFYSLYAGEAEESRRTADEFEASLEREGKLTGPAKVGEFATDFLPPQRVVSTLDGEVLTPPASGEPLVIGSGRHTLCIAAPTTAEAR